MIRFALSHRHQASRLDIAFETPLAGTTALFGPSGAGKSSTVLAMAGLSRPDALRFEIDGVVLADTARGIWVAPERRRVGFVFQDARLFPHMDVTDNLRYGARRAAPGPIGFDEIVGLLGIADLLGRRPHTLSGGERQRVAIGRALLSQPQLLLMDEPLAGLDDARKAEILPYLVALRRRLALPVVYVTHSMAELVQLADNLVLLEAGRVMACGALAELSGRADLTLAARDDAGAVLTLRVAGHDAATRLTRLEGQGEGQGQGEGKGFALSVPLRADAGGCVRVRIPAREVILATAVPEAISVHNVLAGHVRAVVQDAARHLAMVEIVVGGHVLLARVTPDAIVRLALSPGARVLALVKSTSIDVIG